MKNFSLIEPISIAERVANALREKIISEDDGTYLGSEVDIAKTFGISSPTLRQATRLLEHEQILQIKPGKGGGYFTRRPNIETVTNSAALFLVTRELTRKSVNDASDCLMEATTKAAITCKNSEQISQLQKFADFPKPAKAEKIVPEESRHDSQEFAILLAQMSDNIFFEIFARILYNEIYLSKYSKSFRMRDKELRRDINLRSNLAKAIVAKDTDKALRIVKQRSNLFRNWPKFED